MSEVIIYSTRICPYCVRAKRLLERKGVDYKEIRVDRDYAQLRIMLERSRRNTVPQVFIGDQHVGGYDELAALDRAGDLDPLLGLTTADD